MDLAKHLIQKIFVIICPEELTFLQNTVCEKRLSIHYLRLIGEILYYAEDGATQAAKKPAYRS